MKQLTTLIVTLFVGRFSGFPGTLGSLFGMLIWWALLPRTVTGQWILIGGAVVCGWVAVHFYEKWNHCHDPKEVVIDELIGIWITLVGAPVQISVFVVGFLLFRIFDIWKPFPINWVDRRVPGAFGTLLDDVLAGLLASGVLNLLLIPWRHFGITH